MFKFVFAVMVVFSVLFSGCWGGHCGCGTGDDSVRVLDYTGEEVVSGWSFYCEEPGVEREDTWKSEGGVIKCSGEPRGYLYTKESYEDFVLTLRWRWPGPESPGKGGVLFDISGENKIWPKSLEAQINAGDAGDFWGLDGYKVSGEGERFKRLGHDEYGELVNAAKMKAAEKAAGEWNTYKIVAKGEMVKIYINGKKVNEVERVDTSGGKIGITAEGTPIEYADIAITECE